AAAHRGAHAGLDRLLLLLPGLAQVDVDVDQAGAHHSTAHVQDLDVLARAERGRRVLAQAGDLPLIDPEVLHAVDAARGIEDPTAAETEWARHGSWSPPRWGFRLEPPGPRSAPRGDRAPPCARRRRS